MKINSFTKYIFFGNYFYGICAVALSIEATLQQEYPLNNACFYAGIFALTTWYYTKAYITEQTANTVNQRTNWYIVNKKFVRWSQLFLQSFSTILCIFFLKKHKGSIHHISILQVLLIMVFPVVAALYYGINSKITSRYNLRNVGWMKPFVIGFTWAGMVTVYPVLFYKITHQLSGTITLIGCLLFIKNFMFITVLCIMFDIKDYAMDYNQQLKTFVVKTGLRKTIFYILIPLSFAGLGSFLLYGFIRHFSTMKICLNTIPFLLMLTVAYSLHKRKSILYYLILIDGLMLIKAICGSIAMIYF
ncbi:MAG: hypothetical protein HY305_06795 [Sphingobacteriales bacterium]|nr:hypothetical protein [Sphingobacteriales bacterium]